MKKIIVTIDGYSACGKSTLAKALAQELDYGYVDTGAMYRAVTYFFLENRVNIQKSAELQKALTKINITFKSTVAGNRTFLNGKDVEDTIRKMFVSKNVSHVAAISDVRKIVVKQQKLMGKNKGIVMEGRDIGTVVFPNSELKIFLTADEDVRTRRRFDELKSKGQRASLKAVKENLLERDHIDSTRKDSPLKKAKESIVIDNSNLTQREQLLMVLALAKERIKRLNTPPKTAKPKLSPATNKNVKKVSSTKRTPTKASNNKPRPSASKAKPSSNISKNKKEQPAKNPKQQQITPSTKSNKSKSNNQKPKRKASPVKPSQQKQKTQKQKNNSNSTSKNASQSKTNSNSKKNNVASKKQNPSAKKNNQSGNKDKNSSNVPTPQKKSNQRKTNTPKPKHNSTSKKKSSVKAGNGQSKPKPTPRRKTNRKPTSTNK